MRINNYKLNELFSSNKYLTEKELELFLNKNKKYFTDMELLYIRRHKISILKEFNTKILNNILKIC